MSVFVNQHTYQTSNSSVSWIGQRFPSPVFYTRFCAIIAKVALISKRGNYSEQAVLDGTTGILKALERVGVRLTIENLNVLKRLDTPCVFISNHMSALETFIFPSIILPHRKVTFVVKESLINYPVFKHIMRNLHPIDVSRNDPREDLRKVLEGGKRRLKAGTSIIVFPQATRTIELNWDVFSSIGIKLASRTKAPVIPIAVKTDAWGNGRLLKDFGRIDPGKPVHISFGDPITIAGKGREEHKRVYQFIKEKLKTWHEQDDI